MLYFSKLRIFSVIIFTLILSYFSLSNFFKIDDNFFSKNIKLGLDLQGGSYLLLEIDNKPVITQKLQNKVMELKNFFKDKNIITRNYTVDNNSIIFDTTPDKSNELFKPLWISWHILSLEDPINMLGISILFSNSIYLKAGHCFWFQAAPGTMAM